MTDKIIAGKYKVIRELGRGGMGVIYQALHIGLDKTVAIKVLHPEFSKDSVFLKRFQDEARSMAKLDHKNIIRVFDVSDNQGAYYIEMEYFSGKDLKQVMLEESPLSQKRALLIARDVADGLSFSHSKDIIHRDIKPANIMVNPEGHVKIADFGIAKARDKESKTATGSIIGTPEYMSPEQVQGEEKSNGEEKLDGRSDLYSLGMFIYEMITGRTPFSGVSVVTILVNLAHKPEEHTLSFPENTLPSVQKLIADLLKKNRAERIPDAAAVSKRITVILEELQGERSQSGPDPDTVLLETPAKEEPKTRILPKTTSGEKERSKANSKTSDQEKKQKNRIGLISAISIVLIVAGISYYFSSGDGGKNQSQQVSPPAPPSPSAEQTMLDKIEREKEQKAEESRLALIKRDKEQKTEEVRLALIKRDKDQKAEEVRLALIKREKDQKAEEVRLALIKQDKDQKAEEVRLALIKRDKDQKAEEVRLALIKQDKDQKAEEVRLALIKRDKEQKAEEVRLALIKRDKDQKAEAIRLALIKRDKEQKAEEVRLALIKRDKDQKTEAIRLAQIKREKDQKAEEVRLALIKREKNQKTEAIRLAKIKREKKNPPTQDEMNVLGGLLNSLKVAYEKKDLDTLQNMSTMSGSTRGFLEQIFGNYKGIKVSTGDFNIIGGREVHVVISITKLSSLDGNLVVPSPQWKDRKLVLSLREGKWGKIDW